MKIEKHKVKQCCGGSGTSIKIDSPISIEMIVHLCSLGFEESSHFTKNGILYIENKDIVLNGAIGSNTIGIKCKSNKCEESLDELEKILENMS